MKLMRVFKAVALIFLLFSSGVCIAQDEPEIEYDKDGNEIIRTPHKKGFLFGLYIGSYFANNETARIYDGYGFDFEGNRNGFDNSFMRQKIVMEYGGGYGQTDQIAEQIGVDPYDWTFSESDMPIAMRYIPAFMIGFNSRYSVDKKNAILLNINAAKLNVNGFFTITTRAPSTANQFNNAIKTFPIFGVEQRLQFQFGYQRILGDNDKSNFFVEGGLNATIAKYDANYIIINNLQIDLTTYYNNSVNTSNPIFKPVGTGYGLFGGLGMNMTMNPKWMLQLLYSPTYEVINLENAPKGRMQNALGFRAYYVL